MRRPLALLIAIPMLAFGTNSSGQVPEKYQGQWSPDRGLRCIYQHENITLDTESISYGEFMGEILSTAMQDNATLNLSAEGFNDGETADADFALTLSDDGSILTVSAPEDDGTTPRTAYYRCEHEIGWGVSSQSGNIGHVDGKVFKPNDTIYVTVKTTIAENQIISESLEVRWHYLRGDNELVPVKQIKKNLDLQGEQMTEFNISKPDGWPLGQYLGDILLDGERIGGFGYEIKLQ